MIEQTIVSECARIDLIWFFVTLLLGLAMGWFGAWEMYNYRRMN